MADSESSVSKPEAVEEKATEKSSETVEEKPEEGKLVLDPAKILDSVEKPLVEGVTQAARALVENVTQASSSSYAVEVEKEVEKMVNVSDPLASLKNLGADQVQKLESSLKGVVETLPFSDKNVGESSEVVEKPSGDETEKADLKENPRSTDAQYTSLAAEARASWTNCCGLLDLLKRSD